VTQPTTLAHAPRRGEIKKKQENKIINSRMCQGKKVMEGRMKQENKG
jgi:hypothetical protein